MEIRESGTDPSRVESGTQERWKTKTSGPASCVSDSSTGIFSCLPDFHIPHSTGLPYSATVTAWRVRAEAWLREDLETAARRLGAVVSAEVVAELTEHQYAALLSFVFYLGASPKWTIWKRLNARQFDQVPVEMARFVYVGKTKLQGLVKRRAAEIALWSTEEPGSAPDAPPSSYTRAEATPPAAAEPAQR